MSPSTGSKSSSGTSSVHELQRLRLWEIQAVRDILVVGVFFAVIWLGYVMRSVTVPLLVALLLAYLIEPLVVYLCRRYNARRPVVVTGMVAFIAVVFTLCLAIAVPLVVGQTIQMVRDLRYGGRLERTFIALREYVPDSMVKSYDESVESISQFMGTRYRPPRPKPAVGETASSQPATTLAHVELDQSGTTQPAATAPTDQKGEGLDGEAEPPPDDYTLPPLTEAEIRGIVRDEMLEFYATHDPALGSQPVVNSAAVEPGQRPISSIWNVSRATVGAILGFLAQVLKVGFLFFLIPFYLFFFSVWFPDIVAFGRGLIPKAREKETLELLNKMDRVIAGFVRGRIVISIIIGIICAVGWWICGVPYAIVLGLITGIFSAVPYLGGVGLPVAVLLLWVDQLGQPVSQRMSWVWIIGGPSLVFIIMQVLETYVITPTIAGKATNLDPVTILVAVLAGGSIGGVYGMLLSIPVAACLKILLTDVVMPHVRDWVKGRSQDPLPL